MHGVRRQIGENPVSDGLGVLRIGLGKENAELVATHPCGNIPAACGIPERRRNGQQQLVSCLMSEGIVHRLELVDVDCQQ